jgi:hypothetical protein
VSRQNAIRTDARYTNLLAVEQDLESSHASSYGAAARSLHPFVGLT